MLADRLLDELLGPLHMHFLAARKAYQDYLANGRTYLWACSLRRINAAARSILLEKGYLLPKELVPDAGALVRHYDIWLTLWDETARRASPQLDHAFVFENTIVYPREAEARLLGKFEQLRNAA